MARPNLSYLKNLFLALFGVPCGILTGLTGLSNGLPVTAGLRYLVGLRDERAAQAALGATCAAGIGGTLSYLQHGEIAWRWVIPLLVGLTVGGVLAQRIGRGLVALDWVPRVGGLFVAAAGALLLTPASRLMILGVPSLPHFTHTASLTAAAGVVLAGVAALIGLVGGLIRFGGVLLVPAVILLLRAPAHVAQGTAIVVLVIAALPVLLAQLLRPAPENTSKTWVPFGAFFGGLVGAYYATMLSEPASLTAVGSACAVIGVIGMLMKR
jgi:uncharacterized membrane protein YfcA